MSALLGSQIVAGFCSTQLTDTERETNGLLTANPGPKLDPKSIRAINARPAATRKRGQGGGGHVVRD